MKKSIFRNIMIAFFIIVFLFPSNIALAKTYTVGGNTYTYITDYPQNDDDDGADVEGLRFELTGYGNRIGDKDLGPGLGNGVISDNDLTTNAEHGWREYTDPEDGETYVVVAAATHEMLNTHRGRSDKYWFYGAKFDHIHYFSYPEKFQFKFEDTSFDSKVYNGIVLDSADASMFPQSEIYNREKDINMFDVYFGYNDSDDLIGAITGKVVLVSLDGTFRSNANSGDQNKMVSIIRDGFSSLGDSIQTLLHSISKNTSIEKSSKLTFSREELEKEDADEENEEDEVDEENEEDDDEIKLDEKEKEELDVTNAETESDSKTSVIKKPHLSSQLDNKNGRTVTVYDTSTEIPVVQIDVYNLLIGDIDLLDIDFYSSSSTNEDKRWNYFKNIITTYSHIVLYLASALAITALIWRGILMVSSATRDIPEIKADSKKIINGVVKAYLILIGIYILMPMMVYFYNTILQVIQGDDPSKYALRINVDDTFAFNSNTVGWAKLMSMAKDNLESLKGAAAYVATAILNALCFGAMLIRAIIIGGLTIIAPMTAIGELIGSATESNNQKNNIFRFKGWLSIFSKILWFPAVLIVIIRIGYFIWEFFGR